MEKKRKSDGLFIKIREAVSRIPKGRVTTYGQIAGMAGITDARKVGWAVYGNQDPKVPCHRVVFADGSLGVNYSLGGYKEQKRRLEAESTDFIEERKVDLAKYLWKVK